MLSREQCLVPSWNLQIMNVGIGKQVLHGNIFLTQTHQSLAKVGVTGGYRNSTAGNLWSIYGQLAWVHRFAGSTKLEGFEGNSHEVFKTDDLQESYGYLKVSSHWQASDHWRFSANAAGFISEVVKPRYEVGLSAAYRF